MRYANGMSTDHTHHLSYFSAILTGMAFNWTGVGACDSATRQVAFIYVVLHLRRPATAVHLEAQNAASIAEVHIHFQPAVRPVSELSSRFFRAYTTLFAARIFHGNLRWRVFHEPHH